MIGAAERSPAVHQRIRVSAPRICCRGWRIVSWRRIAPRRSGWRPSIRSLYFLLPDGVSYHGHAVSGGKKTGSGPLALKRELRELTGEVQVKQRAVDDTATALEQLEREIAELSEDLESLRALAADPGEGSAGAGSRASASWARNLRGRRSRLSVARLELERLAAGRRAGSANSASAISGCWTRGKRRGRSRGAGAGTIARGFRRAASAGAPARRRARARCARNWRDLKSGSGPSARRRRGTKRQITASGGAAARDRGRDGAAGRGAGAAAGRQHRTGSASRRAGGSDRRAEEAGQRNWPREETTQRDRSSRRWTKTLKQLRAERAGGAGAAVADGSGAGAQAGRAEVSWTRPAARSWACRPRSWPPAKRPCSDEAGLAEAEQKYQEVRARIEALGPVNPQALEEFQEAQQRYDFLNAQRQDLLDSIRDTEKAIQEIDVESRKRFTEAFEAMNG